MARTTHKTSVSRDTQRTDTIYLCPDGSAFVTPDGEGRYWYDWRTPTDYEWDVSLPPGLDDDEAALWVARQQHGDDLPVVILEEVPHD